MNLERCQAFKRPKRCYPSRLEARIAANAMRSKPFSERGNTRLNRERLDSIEPFHCKTCGHWHIGSKRGLVSSRQNACRQEAALTALETAPEFLLTEAAAAYCFTPISHLLYGIGDYLNPTLVQNRGPDYLFSREELRDWVDAGWPKSEKRHWRKDVGRRWRGQ